MNLKTEINVTELSKLVPNEVLMHLTDQESEYLTKIFQRFGGYPSLEQIWQLMDEPWIDFGCDPKQIDERVDAFYQHPVWVLNGLFVEHDDASLEHRRAFTEWIVRQAPLRVADFGGGFGGLARFVGQALPNTLIEVVEPHPRRVAVAMTANTPNVRFVSALSCEYDLMIATDVFEHVPDPIALCAETASHLKVGGQFLIANCFAPVIKCHLPQLFHLEYGWDVSMQKMGLLPGERVQYGRIYRRNGKLDLAAARKVAERARLIYPLIRHLPRGRARFGALIMKLFSHAT